MINRKALIYLKNENGIKYRMWNQMLNSVDTRQQFIQLNSNKHNLYLLLFLVAVLYCHVPYHNDTITDTRTKTQEETTQEDFFTNTFYLSLYL